ncbi:MFS transporter [Actomonas aquatica]|uniref:MFS transporter n=1 Tax=Actomonas aquatica TaxID=2866162 RepID=A0ABZ1CD49_9BACT|nr:MFS transporter [Opitutus sp. WL0086]WRQ88230.1 MFS transporter [Opitutus sp. WL0086]
MSSPTADAPAEGTVITRQQWKWSALAGMASYLDAGSIVALGVGMVNFEKNFGLSKGEVGTLAAIGPNAIGCAVGAIFGGWLGDKLGRKRIYKWDLLVYALGILLVALAMNREMLFIGTVIVGLAVGADVPTSLALVGEFAPAKARGKLLGFTQVSWCLGPVIVFVMAAALSGLGLLGTRIVLFHLFVVALVTWALRRGLSESARWKAAASAGAVKQSVSALFKGRNLRYLIWTATIYLFWNLAAGTAGIFNPYIIETLGAGGPVASVLLSCSGFIIAMLVIVFVFMRHSDGNYRTRRLMWGIGAVVQVIAYGMLLFLPFSIPVVLANIILFSAGGALAGEAFYKVFSQELFPTLLRSTAQGITFGVARVLLGIWSFFVPVLASAGIGQVAGLLTLFLFVSGAVGYFFMPDTSGKSLEQIEAENAA